MKKNIPKKLKIFENFFAEGYPVEFKINDSPEGVKKFFPHQEGFGCLKEFYG